MAAAAGCIYGTGGIAGAAGTAGAFRIAAGIAPRRRATGVPAGITARLGRGDRQPMEPPPADAAHAQRSGARQGGEGFGAIRRPDKLARASRGAIDCVEAGGVAVARGAKE